eukprot:NODE_7946_length_732_cov_78.866995_g7694_i0.p1 GENE.NODE_7946_length_732_cov_78.866995_g7694_i0~~NODE_7946_length_732_cov_78.866995_g7694_i0.p1  ORF type:complete len:181 (+),score=35.80 NODE_7946_length_732_cov_78.866995_g7694_i0:60-602(+)
MTEHQPPKVTARHFPWSFTWRYDMSIPVFYAGREDVFLKGDGTGPVQRLPGMTHASTITPPSGLAGAMRRTWRGFVAGVGAYFFMTLLDRPLTTLLTDQWESPYAHMTLLEKFMYMLAPSPNKLDRRDMYLMMREAGQECPHQGVNFWTYRLHSGHVPRSFFNAPPRSYANKDESADKAN